MALNFRLKKKVAGDLIQIYPSDIAHIGNIGNPIQYRHIQKFLADNTIEFFAVQPRRERPKKILLKGIPETFSSTMVKYELERLNFDIHHVSQVRNFRSKESYPCFLVDIHPTDNYEDLYNLEFFLGYVIKSVPYRSKGPKQCYNCQRFSHSSDNCNFFPRCNKCTQNHHYTQCPVQKNERDKIKYVNCELNHVSNWRGCLKNPRNLKKPAPTQSPIVSNNDREGISFADAAKASNQSEISIPTISASITLKTLLHFKIQVILEPLSFPPSLILKI